MKVILKNSNLVFAKKVPVAIQPVERIARSTIVNNGTVTGGLSTTMFVDIYALTANVTYKISSISAWNPKSSLNLDVVIGAKSELITSGTIAPYTLIKLFNVGSSPAFTEYFTPTENCYLYVSKYEDSGTDYIVDFDIVY